jgi:hypothetical protein
VNDGVISIGAFLVLHACLDTCNLTLFAAEIRELVVRTQCTGCKFGQLVFVYAAKLLAETVLWRIRQAKGILLKIYF